MAFASLGVILAAGYILWMVKRVFYGEVTNPKNENLPDLSRREAVVLVPLVVLALFMGVASPLFTKRIEPAADALVLQVRQKTRPVATAERGPARRESARDRDGGGGAVTGAVDLRPLVPAIIVAFTSLVVLLAQAFAAKGKRPPAAALSLMGLGGALAAVWILATGPGRGAVLAGAVTADGFSLFFQALLLGVAMVTVLLSPSYLRANGLDRGEYYALLLISWSGCSAWSRASSSSRSSWPSRSCRSRCTRWPGWCRDRMESQEAALKYFVTGAFSSAFFLYGIALLYGVSRQHVARPRGAGGGVAVGRHARPWPSSEPGCSSSASASRSPASPSTCGRPTSTRGRPRRSTAFMSAGVKAAAFGALLRVFGSSLQGLAGDWQPLVAVLAVVTMVVGNLGALAQAQPQAPARLLLDRPRRLHAGRPRGRPPPRRRGRALLPGGLRRGEPRGLRHHRGPVARRARAPLPERRRRSRASAGRPWPRPSPSSSSR